MRNYHILLKYSLLNFEVIISFSLFCYFWSYLVVFFFIHLFGIKDVMLGVSIDTNTLLQWNPNFFKTRFFQTTDFSSQKLFAFDLLQSDTVILSLIFKT